MPTSQPRRKEQILERLINAVVARTNLSDLTDSASHKRFLAAVARELDGVYYETTRQTDLFNIDLAAGDDLDERAKDIQPGTLRRLSARRSVGTVQFSRSVATASAVVIPSGTVVKTSDDRIFRTTLQGTIPALGTVSNLVAATAEEAGSNGNVDPSTIVRFQSKPAGVDSVTNTQPFVQGRGRETDDEFRSRLKSFVATLARSTVEAMSALVLGTEDTVSGKEVIFSHIFEDPAEPGVAVLYIDDGNGTAEEFATETGENLTEGLLGPPPDSAVGGEEFLNSDIKPIKDNVSNPTVTSSTRGVLTRGTEYFLNAPAGLFKFDPPLAAAEVITITYDYFTGLIAETQRAVDGDENDRTNFPGFRAAGVRVQVLAPTVVTITVEAVLTIVDGFTDSDVISAVETEVLNYINTRGISGDIVRNELIAVIMGVEGVADVNLIDPAANVPVLDAEITRSVLANLDIQ